MGKATRRKQEQWQARQPDFSTIASVAKRTQAAKALENALYNPMNVIRGYESRAIRPLDNFIPRTRSLNKQTRERELIRYAFNKYNPPEFLYAAWDRSNIQRDYLFGPKLREDYRLWYLALVQGKSLYKECTMGLLTKQETHHFSTCHYPLTIPQAIWYAVIRCLDEKAPMALARKLASTKLSDYEINDFWKGVARWFIKNETTVRNTNDLLDYINNRHRENAEWYIKDQTLKGMQRAMQSWHREMYRSRTMEGKYKFWPGIEVNGMSIVRTTKKGTIKWHFHQILTGKELATEGNKQHHCVSSYAPECHSGQCSIWSLTWCDEFNSPTRALTIEVRASGVIVQARGYANRPARPEEISVLKEWATKNGFHVRESML